MSMPKNPQYSARLLMDIVDTLATPIFIKNDQHQWIIVNDAFCEFIGKRKEELIGKSDHDFFPKEEADIFWKMDREVFKTGEASTNEEEFTDSQGVNHTIITQKMLLADDEYGHTLCGVITDVTQLKDTQRALDKINTRLTQKVTERTQELNILNEKLKKLAYQDDITGLMNRTAIYKTAKQYIEKFKTHQQKFSLFYIDMDGLKFINDSYGHPVGDMLINGMGERLSDAIEGKADVARIGGDEFLLLFAYQNQQEISDMADRIITLFKQPIKLKERSLTISVSIGIARCPEDGQDITSLVQYADNAMYETKRTNKGHYLFYQREYTIAVKRKLEIESALREAVEKKALEFYFQPIYFDGNFVGYECLSRWFSDEFGSVPPIEFIPIAEESTLIIELGEQVVVAAVEFIRNHCDKNEYVSINVSPIQLQSDSFKPMLENIFRQSNIKPEQLAIEVTEGQMTVMNMHFENLFSSPLLKGLRYFVDDFGTGYSNLAQLKKLNFNILKIDREFIKDLPNSSVDISLIKAMVLMANEFDMGIIAEGVETEEQKQCLLVLGCSHFQGYLFGRPERADTYPKVKK